MKTSIKKIIKDNVVSFRRYRKGVLYYGIMLPIDVNGIMLPIDVNDPEFGMYEFPVPIDDCGDADFFGTDKAIMFMRYIRKALEDGTFVKVA